MRLTCIRCGNAAFRDMWLGEVGLYSYRARAYNPRIGRFMQTDPIMYEGGRTFMRMLEMIP